MAYFPFFMDLSGKRGLVAGGGPVALRKIQKLLPYGPSLTVAAGRISPEIAAIPGLELLRENFSPALLEGRFFVIAATDSRTLNREIAADLLEEAGSPVDPQTIPGAALMVTPRDIDQRVEDMAKVIGYAVSLALQPGLDLKLHLSGGKTDPGGQGPEKGVFLPHGDEHVHRPPVQQLKVGGPGHIDPHGLAHDPVKALGGKAVETALPASVRFHAVDNLPALLP